MQIIHEPAEMQELTAGWRCAGHEIGFVPTMGALHRGHIELCHRARAENSRFVASIFVNPAQFGANEDLDQYPRPFEKDAELLREAGCHALFAPAPSSMYARDNDFLHGTWVDVSPFDEMWEGVTRPGHMRGVATVVTKLFNIVGPQRAYFGEKDFQQLKMVEALVRDLNFPVRIVPVPTIREPDGLALSSRNVYLSPEERRAAAIIPRALRAGAVMAADGETDVACIGQCMAEIVASEPAINPQYFAVVNATTLQPLTQLTGSPARIIAAVYAGKTRLIDNWPI